MTTRDRKRLRRVGHRIKCLERKFHRAKITFGEYLKVRNLLINEWLIGSAVSTIVRRIDWDQAIKKPID